jgi:adenosylcobyric acid synthase
VDRPSDWGCPQLVILPGSRSVATDLAWLRERGLAEKIVEHAASGGLTMGICGGYQMLGREIRDPERVESEVESLPGLGLLDVVTTFAPAKVLTRAEGRSLAPGWEGLPVAGYEIHHGTAMLGAEARPAFHLVRRLGSTSEATDGAVDPTGRVLGTYLHGLFDGAEFRQALFARLGVAASPVRREVSVFDRLADWWQENANTGFVEQLLAAQGG